MHRDSEVNEDHASVLWLLFNSVGEGITIIAVIKKQQRFGKEDILTASKYTPHITY